MISIPKIVSRIFVKSIDWLTGGTSTAVQKDPNGKTIYEDGRHTIESFGDRKQFEVLKGVRIDGQGNIIHNNIRWCLFDRDKNKDIDIDIDAYEYIRPYIMEKDPKGRYKQIDLPEDELKPYVYTKGSKGYTRLNYKTAEIKQSKDISDFFGEDQEIFKSLDAGKGRSKTIENK